MSQKEFLQVPLQAALEIYNNQLVPRLTTRNKVIAITSAISLSLIFYIRQKVFKPPKIFRHLPYDSAFNVIKAAIQGECLSDYMDRETLSLLYSENSKGLCMRPGIFGWEVWVGNPEDAKRVLLKHELFPKVDIQKSTSKHLLTRFLGGPNVATLNGQAWKSQRMVTNPAFRRSMPVKVFGKLTQDLFAVMETMDPVVNLTDLMQRWTLEVIGRVGFGFEFNAIKNQNNNEWVDIYNELGKGMQDPLFFLFPFLDSKFLWLFPKRKLLHQKLDTFLDMLETIITHKRQDLKQGNVHNDSLEENERDLLTLMIESEMRGEGAMKAEELKNNLCLFFLAGHDTTANALSCAIHYLAENPEIQQRAREEAISILGNEPCDVLPTIEDTKRMVYINQILKETLRMNGPTPIIIPRIAAEDTTLSGTFIPKGTFVNVAIQCIQHSEMYWKDPETFDPDRFSEDGEKNISTQGMTFLPFGGGPRTCLGQNMSYNEQRVMMSMLLRKFEWSTPENSVHKNKVVMTGFNVVGPVKMDIKFKRRY